MGILSTLNFLQRPHIEDHVLRVETLPACLRPKLELLDIALKTLNTLAEARTITFANSAMSLAVETIDSMLETVRDSDSREETFNVHILEPRGTTICPKRNVLVAHTINNFMSDIKALNLDHLSGILEPSKSILATQKGKPICMIPLSRNLQSEIINRTILYS